MSDIDKPAITTSLGALKRHFDKTQHTETRNTAKRDPLTVRTHMQIEDIHQKARRLTRHSYDHHAKHRDKWVDRQYGKLLKDAGNAREFKPSWASNDNSAHLRRAAEKLVDQRHSRRLRTIQRAMIQDVKKAATQAIGNVQSKGRREDRGR